MEAIRNTFDQLRSALTGVPGEIVGIDVIEHIVLADASYYSMKTAKLF